MARSVSQATFKQEVLEAPTPVLVNFWAPWCGLCRLVDPIILETQANWKGQLKLVGVNADENLKLVSLYKLTTLPTIMLFNEGTALYRMEQFRSREDFRTTSADLGAALEKIVSQYSLSR
ncbi:MAG: thioredoxin [Oscillatoriophycideae cyanobacterium NC_groundwater_1537_Pr4_S-0.65um_50_18]|nr:thioredoxin [Oscillatoriophycideae cyanobacterium NC_groundwater_1537_Pr4_S-0.65um_50_18]